MKPLVKLLKKRWIFEFNNPKLMLIVIFSIWARFTALPSHKMIRCRDFRLFYHKREKSRPTSNNINRSTSNPRNLLTRDPDLVPKGFGLSDNGSFFLDKNSNICPRRGNTKRDEYSQNVIYFVRKRPLSEFCLKQRDSSYAEREKAGCWRKILMNSKRNYCNLRVQLN